MNGKLPLHGLRTEEHRLSTRRLIGWCGGGVAMVALATICLVAFGASGRSGPTIEAREVAAWGPADPNRMVTEPGVAAGPNHVVAVFFHMGRNFSASRGYYAALDLSDPNWSEGNIPAPDYSRIGDLSIAYDSVGGGFMAAALGFHTWSNRDIVICRYDRTGFDPNGWQSALDPDDVGAGEWDKPWIVAGEAMPGGQEYYIVYWRADVGGPNCYRYVRSIDGGNCWADERIYVEGSPLQGAFCAQPAVYDDGPLYVAYAAGSNTIRFLKGEDVDPNNPNSYDCNSPSEVGVKFSPLYSSDTTKLSISLNRGRCDRYLPGSFISKRVPQFAVDPTDPNQLFVAYHDTATSEDSDVNIYLHKLRWHEEGQKWSAGARIQVNDDNTEFQSDQFMPALTVDDQGYLHLIFYDDRRFTDPGEGDPKQDQQPDGTANPKFDVYYAYSKNEGSSWTNERLFLDSEDPNDAPALNFALETKAEPLEYIGIAWYDDDVWTAYMGTWSGDEDNESVIWSSRIDWSGK